MRKVHDEALIQFLRNPDDSTRNSFALVIAADSEGWAVPISLKFKPENISLQDCGLTGFI
jgi:hypothetical protein